MARYGAIAITSLVVIAVALAGCGFNLQFGGESRWTSECQERAGNAYNIGHPYSKDEIAKACVDRAEQIEGLGESDSEVREILNEFGSLNKN